MVCCVLIFNNNNCQILLHNALTDIRNTIADKRGISPYMVASNLALLEMAKRRPSSFAGFLSINDFSEERAKRFGQEFIDKIAQFCAQHHIDMDYDKSPQVCSMFYYTTK